MGKNANEQVKLLEPDADASTSLAQGVPPSSVYIQQGSGAAAQQNIINISTIPDQGQQPPVSVTKETDGDSTNTPDTKVPESINQGDIDNIAEIFQTISECKELKQLFGDKITELFKNFSSNWQENPNSDETIKTLQNITEQMFKSTSNNGSPLSGLMIKFCNSLTEIFHYILAPNKFDREFSDEDTNLGYNFMHSNPELREPVKNLKPHSPLDGNDILSIKDYVEQNVVPSFDELASILQPDDKNSPLYISAFGYKPETSETAISNDRLIEKIRQKFSSIKPREYDPLKLLNQESILDLKNAIELLQNSALVNIKDLKKEILKMPKQNFKLLFQSSNYSKEYKDLQDQIDALEIFIQSTDKALEDIKHKLNPYKRALPTLCKIAEGFKKQKEAQGKTPLDSNPYDLRRVQEYLLATEDIAQNVLAKIPKTLADIQYKKLNKPGEKADVRGKRKPDKYLTSEQVSTLVSYIHSSTSEEKTEYLSEEWLRNQINYKELSIAKKQKRDLLARQLTLNNQMGYFEKLLARGIALDPKINELVNRGNKLGADNVDTSGWNMPDWYEQPTHSSNYRNLPNVTKSKNTTPSKKQIKVEHATALARLCAAVAKGEGITDYIYNENSTLVKAINDLKNSSPNTFKSKFTDVSTLLKTFAEALKKGNEQAPKESLRANFIELLEYFYSRKGDLPSNSTNTLDKIANIANKKWRDFLMPNDDSIAQTSIQLP